MYPSQTERNYFVSGNNQQTDTKLGDPRPPLDAAIDGLASSLSELDGLMAQMESRLARVLKPSPPATAGGSGPQGVSETSPAVDQLHALRARVTGMCVSAMDVMNRLET